VPIEEKNFLLRLAWEAALESDSSTALIARSQQDLLDRLVLTHTVLSVSKASFDHVELQTRKTRGDATAIPI
jgi:hypothetical protein